MNTKEFVELFYIEKENILKQYFNNLKDTEVGLKINSLGLTPEQIEKMKNIINSVLIDAMYTILLGLDGESSIGNVQETYKLFDAIGTELTNCGEIEQYAYEYFQQSK